MRFPLKLALAAFLLLMGAACDPSSDGQDAATPGPDQIAFNLRPAVQLEGEPAVTYTIADRMDHYAVPGLSVAVLDDGEIAWARGWGVSDTETGAPVTSTTLFQAASISKPAAALGAMTLVEEGALGLDDSVNEHLTSWHVPENRFTADSAVTLRGILSHTAGLTVWGFPGYRKDEPFADGVEIATNVDVLDGLGNTDSVRVFREPGIAWLYSGGGYTVMEQMVEDVTGRSFEQAMRERVLEPAGMTRSTYEQPLPAGRWGEAARGHGGDGSEVEGEWHSYPEQAAAGLWTTPSDLLTLSAHLLDVLEGRTADGIVSRASLETMLEPHRFGEEGFEPYGLGFGIEGEGETLSFGHGGSNAGFRAQWIVFPALGDGAVVMTNGDRGAQLASEVLRALAEAYDWPRPRAEVRAHRALTATELAAYAGEYELEAEPEFVVTMRAGDGVLLFDVPEQGTYTLHADAEVDDRFFDASDAQTLTFERDDDGVVTALILPGDQRMRRR